MLGIIPVLLTFAFPTVISDQMVLVKRMLYHFYSPVIVRAAFSSGKSKSTQLLWVVSSPMRHFVARLLRIGPLERERVVSVGSGFEPVRELFKPLLEIFKRAATVTHALFVGGAGLGKCLTEVEAVKNRVVTEAVRAAWRK